MEWAKLLSTTRICSDGTPEPPEDPQALRSHPIRDFDRIVFSDSFRRLHDKTQVFPLPDNDQVHSRLTHSLEVASVGRSLGHAIGEHLQAGKRLPHGWTLRDVGDAVAAACLAHDLGNPPFGHSGEDAIGAFFRALFADGRGGAMGLAPAERVDLERFEGNAQGFRLLTRTEMEASKGMRLTATTLGAFGKYPRGAGADQSLSKQERKKLVPEPPVFAKKFGVFQSELCVLTTLAEQLGLPARPGADHAGYARHPLAWLVEAADDVCYRILDLEDGARLRLVPFELADALLGAFIADPKRRARRDGSSESDHLARLRGVVINDLIYEVRGVFLANEGAVLSGAHGQSLTDQIPSHDKLAAVGAEVKKRCYHSPGVLDVELSGYEILHAILSRLVGAAFAVASPNDAAWLRASGFDRIVQPDEGERLLRRCHLLEKVQGSTTRYEAFLRITDYVSGMTDSFAVTLYRHLHGVSLPGRDRR